MSFIDKKIPIHSGSYKYYKEIGYISDKLKHDNSILSKKFHNNINKDNIKCYWKYKKDDLTKYF